jgi:two-component system, cell cycle sensor histidine kinase and response regulator CckA
VELLVSHAPGACRVMADPGQLEQVIVNLAVNARDAMPDGGRLTIATACLEGAPYGGTPAGRIVRITVADTGCGMDKATLARVFEPFFTTKEPGKGTGMGLATVYGIVSQSGGHISASSMPGSGSTFVIDLPRIDLPDERLPEPASGPPVADGRGETILLVDDETPIRAVLGRSLGRHGYHVIEAGSGTEALERAESAGRPIDLLVTDVRMPGIQGPELARRLRLHRPELPVLFISATDAERVDAPASSTHAAGAGDGRAVVDAIGEEDGTLAKPFDIEEFLRAVRASLDRGR